MAGDTHGGGREAERLWADRCATHPPHGHRHTHERASAGDRGRPGARAGRGNWQLARLKFRLINNTLLSTDSGQTDGVLLWVWLSVWLWARTHASLQVVARASPPGRRSTCSGKGTRDTCSGKGTKYCYSCTCDDHDAPDERLTPSLVWYAMVRPPSGRQAQQYGRATTGPHGSIKSRASSRRRACRSWRSGA